MHEKAYTTVQVARLLGVHKNTVFYWLKTGKIQEPKRDALFNGRIWTEEDIRMAKEIAIQGDQRKVSNGNKKIGTL